MTRRHRNRKEHWRDWKRHGGTGTASLPSRLQEIGFGSYQAYLASQHWADLKSRFYASKLCSRSERGRPCCVACRRDDVRLSVHHRTYRRLGREWLMDLMVVCDSCHDTCHAATREFGWNLWGASKATASQRRILQKLKTDVGPAGDGKPTPSMGHGR
jgi:hypothetical protein